MTTKKICVDIEELNNQERSILKRLLFEASKERSVYGTKIVHNAIINNENDNLCVLIDEREFNIDAGLRSAQLRQSVCFNAARDKAVSKDFLEWLRSTVFTEP